MKLISLNTYGARIYEPFMQFIQQHRADTDIFCFQEMYSNPKENLTIGAYQPRINLFEELQRQLNGFNGHMAITQDDYEIEPELAGDSHFGLSTFIRKTHNVDTVHEFYLCNGRNTFVGGKAWDTLGYNALSMTLAGDRPVTVINLHGNALPDHKLDDPVRTEQTRRILEFCKTLNGEIIICGDFNSLPGIDSIVAFEKNGFRDLIKDHNIQTTRGSLMRELHPEFEHGKYGWQEYADYVFVTPGINVTSFEVPDEPISDHLPLILSFDV